MAYILREDGERFIIPSYRDVLSIKKPTLLRREILLLSQNYGEYIALQRKNVNQYEVAFSPEPGYLLGETVWHYFKRPQDLIYCEAIPNTFEAILVIVRAGVVYIDGSFPIDSIPDELVILRTQQNYFDIYIYGDDIPISETPDEGKFTFDHASVKSFVVLDKPVFPTLPTNKAFQLQLVDLVLKSKRIGTFPTKIVISILALLGLIFLAWNLITSHKKELPQSFISAVDPYQAYLNILSSPAPAVELEWFANYLVVLGSIPGWVPVEVSYANEKLIATLVSLGATTHLLKEWARQNNVTIEINPQGFSIRRLRIISCHKLIP